MPKNIDQFKNKNIFAFAGIGNPNNFFDLLSKYGFNIRKKIALPDHHALSEKELNKIINKSIKNNLEIITTEKDYFRYKDYGLSEIKCIKLNLEIFWCAARRRCGCIFRACGTQNSRRHCSSLLSRRNVWARKTRVRCRDRVNFPRKSSRNRCKYSTFLTRDAPQLQPPPLRKVQNRSAATGCVRCAFDGRKITRSAVHLRKICVDNIRIGCSIFSILARGAPQTRVILPILRCAKLLSSAQLSFESV